ncbi:hypothetical protein GA0070603_6082 [Micromonospora chersina]|uniref:Transposase n=1 Tax=Micromonospora chersina TaxID=47854 RepID=A0A1C6W038_9ACTN|nr:hypothetical protein GA0070603_6082 [Micromonospora chersina]
MRRHAGAARFGYNQCLRLVKDALDGKRGGTVGKVPWSGFDLINAFNRWKRSGDAGRVMVAAGDGTVTVQVTGLAWRGEVCQQVFEEAAVDLGRGLSAYKASRTGHRRGRRVGFPRFKSKKRAPLSFRIRSRTSAAGRAGIRVGEHAPRTVTLPGIGTLTVRQDTRRLRRMLAKGRAKVVSATVSHRAGRWAVSLTCEAADLHEARRHQPNTDAAGWVGVDRGLSTFVAAARADGTQVLRVDGWPRPARAAVARQRRLSRKVTGKQRGSYNRARPQPGWAATTPAWPRSGAVSCTRSPTSWSIPTTGSPSRPSPSPACSATGAWRRRSPTRHGANWPANWPTSSSGAAANWPWSTAGTRRPRPAPHAGAWPPHCLCTSARSPARRAGIMPIGTTMPQSTSLSGPSSTTPSPGTSPQGARSPTPAEGKALARAHARAKPAPMTQEPHPPHPGRGADAREGRCLTTPPSYETGRNPAVAVLLRRAPEPAYR